MTGAALMTTFTPEAEARLDEYLRQVRAALARDPEVSPDEIEADVREHIDAEFRSAVRPVTATELEAVLVRLGPPQTWAAGTAAGRSAKEVAVGDLTAFGRWLRLRARGVLDALWRGPEDWRLAYLTFGLFVLGVLTVPIAVGALLLLAGYILGRATVELAKEKGAPLGARRWLVYPSILAVSLPLFLAVMLWPVVAAPTAVGEVNEMKQNVRLAELAESDLRAGRHVPPAGVVEADRRVLAAIPGPRDWAEPVAGTFALVGALSLWWTVVGLVMWAFPKWPPAVFHPLLDGYDGGHGLRLAAVSGVAFLIWLGFATRFLQSAGLT
jgi:hypothetical protein